MRQAQQLPLFFPEPPKDHKARRKLSLKPQASNSLDEGGEDEELKSLGEYIQSNIQSKRKNIMQLYSTTISFLQHSECVASPQTSPSPTQKKWTRKRTDQLLEPLTPHLKRTQLLQSEKPDSSMIVSNKFPEKVLKPKTLLERVARLSPRKPLPVQKLLLTDTQQNDPPFTQKHDKPKNCSALPPMTPPKRTKLKKLQAQYTPNQINPWEYLVIPQEPCFNL